MKELVEIIVKALVDEPDQVEITEELNFPNQSFLGNYFKEHVGMSPSQYRRS